MNRSITYIFREMSEGSNYPTTPPGYPNGAYWFALETYFAGHYYDTFAHNGYGYLVCCDYDLAISFYKKYNIKFCRCRISKL